MGDPEEPVRVRGTGTDTGTGCGVDEAGLEKSMESESKDERGIADGPGGETVGPGLCPGGLLLDSVILF